MKKFSCFIENDDCIKEKFFLYAAPEIGLYIHSKNKEDILEEIRKRNVFLKNITDKVKKEQEQKPNVDENKEDILDNTEDMLSTIDIDKITEEQAKDNPHLEIVDKVISIIYNEENLNEIEISIKQPNTNDILSMQQSAMISIAGKPKLDENAYRHLRLIRLLKDWNIQKEDSNGNLKKVPVTEQNIGKLHPKVYNSIMFYIDSNIDLHLENLLI